MFYTISTYSKLHKLSKSDEKLPRSSLKMSESLIVKRIVQKVSSKTGQSKRGSKFVKKDQACQKLV